MSLKRNFSGGASDPHPRSPASYSSASFSWLKPVPLGVAQPAGQEKKMRVRGIIRVGILGDASISKTEEVAVKPVLTNAGAV
jgi:hypothetical protein